ncbi:MAG: ATPase [Bacteroidaceae bacterium]|nr:ATPase [Bacteroidaceae bacterium]
MKLVVDSGSTKTDWGFFNNKKDLTIYKTQGINPYHQSQEQIRDILEGELLPNIDHIDRNQINELFFYGAGCATKATCELMSYILKGFFPNATISVDSDMLGAARALCGKSEGVACVLGTGSNSCLYNGKDIIDQVPSLGYILGDEGSGAALGRCFINSCFKRQMPDKLYKEFLDRYSVDRESIIMNVYRKPLANRYLAGFVPFILEKREVPEVHKMIIQCFTEFFTRNVINYHKPWLPVHIVGSIANSLADELRETADSLGMTIGMILPSPINRLIEYHNQKS